MSSEAIWPVSQLPAEEKISKRNLQMDIQADGQIYVIIK